MNGTHADSCIRAILAPFSVRLGFIRPVAAYRQGSRPRIGVSSALAARTGSKYSRRNAILPPAARRNST